jgi:predicted HD phosphohydrolase
MREGTIEQVGTPETIYGAPASRFVAGFIGKMNQCTVDATVGTLFVQYVSAVVLVAALLHDIGHLLGDQDEGALAREDRDGRHETHGAALLKRFFRPEVARPVALHVAAKRDLCAVDAGYTDGLSPASTRSLELQGGPLDARQARAFERRAGWQDAVLLRRWDDAAKVPGLPVPGFAGYRTLLEDCLRSGEAARVPSILRAPGGPVRIP